MSFLESFCPYLKWKIIGVMITQLLKMEAMIPLLTPLFDANWKHAMMTTCYQPWRRPLMMGTQKQIQLSS